MVTPICKLGVTHTMTCTPRHKKCYFIARSLATARAMCMQAQWVHAKTAAAAHGAHAQATPQIAHATQTT